MTSDPVRPIGLPHVARYSWRFHCEYRIRAGLRSRYLETVAATLGEAAHLALQRAHRWRGVIKIDALTLCGSPAAKREDEV